MAFDLRGFLEHVRQQHARELLVVEDEVAGDWEMAAIVAGLEAKMRTPIVEFRHVAGCGMPVVTNVFASLPRVARVLGMSVEELENRIAKAYDAPIAPRAWDENATAPVREEIRRGEDVDLGALPQIRYTEAEKHPYITAAIVVARDPDSGALNLSYHRLMHVGRRELAIFMAPGGHLERIFAAGAEAGRSTPVAVFIGAHPLWSLGSLASGSLQLDELGVIGGLLGEPLEVVPAEVDPALLLPARAEIALEGWIRHDRSVEEGPFGEFAGYAASSERCPVLEVEVMSHRRDPVYQDIVSGRLEHLTMCGVTLRVHLVHDLAKTFPFVTDVHLPAPLTAYLQVDRRRAEGKAVSTLLEHVLENEPYLKYAYCLDADIDLRNPTQVQWAIATRSQADKDAVMIPDRRGTGLDPSERTGKTCKWGLDATAKPDLDHYAPLNRIPAEVRDRVNVDRYLRR